jgi:replication factor C subunit 2/4
MGRRKLTDAEKMERLNARKELKNTKNTVKPDNDGVMFSKIKTETTGLVTLSKRGRKSKNKTSDDINENTDSSTKNFYDDIITNKNIVVQQNGNVQISVHKNTDLSTTNVEITINKSNLPWIEKYRPKSFDDIILDPILKNKLANLVSMNMLSNLIITGTSGTGKTSTTLCLAKMILGNKYNEYILELNASDNRGLEIINNSVIYFCKKKVNLENGLKKIVIFDEADNLTNKAQNVLVNMMEEFKQTTIFCFTCNDSSKLIESIQSRCLILNYRPINEVNIRKRLIYICQKENVNYDDKGLESLIFISQGDIRQAINNLEATYNSYDIITEENVYKLCYQPHPNALIQMIQKCVNKNLKDAILKYNELKEQGYCNSDILQTTINALKLITIDEHIRISFIKILSDTYLNVNDGVDTNLQMYSCISTMITYMLEYQSLTI